MKRLGLKQVGVPSISDDGTFLTAPLSWLPWLNAGSPTNVTEEGSMALPTVYACIRVLSEDVASLPMILYRRRPDGGKERATDHPYYELFHDAPNPEMTSFTWRETLMAHVLGWGNSFDEKTYDGFGRLQLWPVRSGRIEVRWEAGRKRYYDTITGRYLKDDSIFHIPGLSLNGLVGLSPIALHRLTLGEQMATRDFGRAFYKNMARPATILKHPKSLSTPAADRLKSQVEDLKGARNAGKTVVLEEGLDYKEIGIAPEDAQYVETRKLQREEAAQLFRMPPHKVGILDHATFSNIEHQAIDYVSGTLRPWLVRIEQAIKTQLLADEPDIYVEFLVDALLRGDAASRATALATRWQHGTLSPDEWRALENENPLPDGKGDVTYVPVNYQAVGAPVPVPDNVISLPDAIAAATKSGDETFIRLASESIAAQERMSERFASSVGHLAGAITGRPIDARTDVHLDAGAVQVSSPVTVMPAEIPAPQVTVNVPKPAPVRRQLMRDGKVQAELVEEPV